MEFEELKKLYLDKKKEYKNNFNFISQNIRQKQIKEFSEFIFRGFLKNIKKKLVQDGILLLSYKYEK